MTDEEMMVMLEALKQAPVSAVVIITYAMCGMLHSGDLYSLYALALFCGDYAKHAIARLEAETVLCGEVTPEHD